MAHQRQLIREAVKKALVGKTAAGPRVYETRTTPWLQVQLPAVAVYTLDETVDQESRKTAPRELSRSLKLVVEAVVMRGENVDDALDAMSLEIEAALDADPTFGDLCADSLLSTTELAVGDSGARSVGLLTMTYQVSYQTQAPTVLPVLDDLKTVGTTTDLSGTTAAGNQAHDVIPIPVT